MTMTINKKHYVKYDEYLILTPEELEMSPLIDITISVTEEHIRVGDKKQCSSCPIALAIKEFISPFVSLAVAFELTLHYKKRTENWCLLHNHVIDLPQEALTFIKEFDDGEAVDPFKFELKIPKCLLKPSHTVTTL